jgi:hypothetical protein
MIARKRNCGLDRRHVPARYVSDIAILVKAIEM